MRVALTPDYPFRCKRVLLGADYYAALQQDSVTLVTDPISRIDEGSVVTTSGRVDVDAIVLATGFQTSHYLAGIDETGRNGVSLHRQWGEDPSAYLGVAVSGFPNFFMLYGPNTNQGGNSIVYALEAGARLVASAVSRLARQGGCLEVHSGAEDRFNREIDTELSLSVWTQCDSYFRSPGGRIVTQWPYTELDYARRTWRLRKQDWSFRRAGRPPRGREPMTPSVSSVASS